MAPRGPLLLLLLLFGMGMGFGQTVSIVAADADASEAGLDPGRFTISVVDGGIIENLEVDLEIDESSTATSGSDYVPISTTVTISVILTSGSTNINVDPIDDALVELPETITLNLLPGSYAIDASKASATVTLASDDLADVSIANGSNGEENGGGTVVNGLMTVSQSVVSPVDTEITYVVSGGTATPSVDYAALGGTLTLVQGETSAEITIPVFEDALVEGEETVEITLTEITSGLAQLVPDPVAVTSILDDDAVLVSIDNPAPVNEGDSGTATLTFTVDLDQIDPFNDTTVSYVISGGNENGESGNVVIPSGAVSTTLEVTTNGDTEQEGDEAVSVSLISTDNGTISGTANVGSSSFIDDDVPPGLCPGLLDPPPFDAGENNVFCDVINVDLNDYLTDTSAPAGTVLTWSVDSNPLETTAHIDSNVTEPGLYYGFYYDAANTCHSPVVEVLLVRNYTPEIVPERSQGGSLCGAGSILLEVGAQVTDDSTILLSWYDAPTGGNLLGTGSSYQTGTLSETTSFYVEASANGCATPQRFEVVATVNQTPTPGVATDTTACNIVGLGGPNVLDLDSTLSGADAGVWTLIVDPSNGSLVPGVDNTVDFQGMPPGDYVFEYTTIGAEAPCVNTSVEVTVSVGDCLVDTDGDGLLDTEEQELGTDPERADTDGDGLTDGEEVLGVDDPATPAVPEGPTDPLDPCDPFLTPDCNPEDIDLALAKSVDRDLVMLGDRVRFTIRVENTTMDRVLDLVIGDLLEEGFGYESSSATLGTYDEISGQWTLDELGPEESASLEVTALVLLGGTLENTARLISSFPKDGLADNNTASVTVRAQLSQCQDPGTLCNIFSPNGDGVNDQLVLVGHQLYPQNRLEIFDRYGNRVFHMNGYDSSWEGTGSNGDLPKGTYYYLLDLQGDGTQVAKGWIQIVRNN